MTSILLVIIILFPGFPTSIGPGQQGYHGAGSYDELGDRRRREELLLRTSEEKPKKLI